MQLVGFVILVVVNCCLGEEKSARNVVIRNAMVVGCVGKKQMKTLFEPPLARDTDPITSHEAAEKMVKSGELNRQEKWVYDTIIRYLKYYPPLKQRKDFTTKDIANWTDRYPYYKAYDICRKRFSGLRNKGKIERTGKIRDGCFVERLK